MNLLSLKYEYALISLEQDGTELGQAKGKLRVIFFGRFAMIFWFGIYGLFRFVWFDLVCLVW